MDVMIFIVENPAHFEHFTPEQWRTHGERHALFVQQVADAGAEVLFSDPLEAESERFPALVLDGPYAESKEIVLGYYKLRVRDEAQARELAALCPTVGWVELRAVNTGL